MLKRAVLVTSCALALVASAVAQQAAAIVMRSGERISGELVDYGASGFVISVNGATRQIPANDVARVEFSGRRPLNADQQAKLNTGQPFMVLNDGQTIDGRLYDIGGTKPLRISIDTSSGQRDFNSTDVAGLYFANAGGVEPVAKSGQAVAGTFVVPANRQWTPISLTVSAGETLRFQASGEIRFTPRANDRADPAGSLAQKRVLGAPISAALAGALIGRIGDGAPFMIGSQASVNMPASGLLLLGINDDKVSDNGGWFRVVISR